MQRSMEMYDACCRDEIGHLRNSTKRRVCVDHTIPIGSAILVTKSNSMRAPTITKSHCVAQLNLAKLNICSMRASYHLNLHKTPRNKNHATILHLQRGIVYRLDSPGNLSRFLHRSCDMVWPAKSVNGSPTVHEAVAETLSIVPPIRSS